MDTSSVLSREDIVSTFAALWGGKYPDTIGGDKVDKSVELKPDESVAEFSARLSALEQENAQLKSGNATATAELATLRFQLRKAEVGAKLEALKRQGKLIPACEAAAEAILLNGDSMLKFNDSDMSISSVFEQFLAALPPLVNFNEVGPSGNTDDSQVQFSDELINLTMQGRPDIKTREECIEFLKKYGNR